jgi:cobaltochelatase CobT
VLGLCARAIAADDESASQLFAPGKPELDGKSHRQLPEPSRVAERARDRRHSRLGGQPRADGGQCTIEKLHKRRLAPGAGPARTVFEAVERARIEALGCNRMQGMASKI